MSERAMTVGQLRAALVGVSDDMEVVLRVSVDDGEETYVCGLRTADPCAGCTDTVALMLDGYEDAEERDCCGEYESGSGKHGDECPNAPSGPPTTAADVASYNAALDAHMADP